VLMELCYNAIQGGISCLLLEKIVWLLDFILLGTMFIVSK